ncbi:hypothetical protein [Streptomyces bacillaris]|uniref:hypothetical protein n=1 Tax=Streptomyces bacillaris TaxID=68179 RepID=UPI003649D937
MSPDAAAAALGYLAALVRRATARAHTVLRARHAAPYLADVAAVHRAGWTTTETAPDVQLPGDDRVIAAIVLDSDQARPPPWSGGERYGWRTATSRRHPTERGRYLAGGITPLPGGVVAALAP